MVSKELLVYLCQSLQGTVSPRTSPLKGGLRLGSRLTKDRLHLRQSKEKLVPCLLSPAQVPKKTTAQGPYKEGRGPKFSQNTTPQGSIRKGRGPGLSQNTTALGP